MESDRSSGIKQLVFLVSILVTGCLPAQSLQIETFDLQAVGDGVRELAAGGEFEVGVSVANHDAGTLTFVLRTLDPIDQANAPPTLSHYNKVRRLAFMPETNGSVQLLDGGARDLNPARNAFKTRISTLGWRSGRYELGLFAHNSTDRRHGRYEAVCAKFAVIVTADTVRLIDRCNPSKTRIKRAAFVPDAIRAGEAVTLEVSLSRPDLIGLKVATALRVAPEKILPDLRYDAVSRTAFLSDPDSELVLDQGALDSNGVRGAVGIPLRTEGMQPGLYMVSITALADEGSPDVRQIALRIKSPADRLQVTVSEPWVACKGASAGRFTWLSDGTLLYGRHHSKDGGRTWVRSKNGGINGGCPVLRDGRVIVLDYSWQPVAEVPGLYSATLQSFRGNEEVVTREAAVCRVPLAKAARGHAQHRGPLSTGSFVEREDGVLLALMMGWFVGDDALCPYGNGRPYSRSYICSSTNGGRAWEYLETVGYDMIGSEGYNEGTLAMLPSGEIVAVLRTGNMTDMACQDNPVMVTRSSDGGQTWMRPWRVGVNGAYPVVTVLSDGCLAMSSGRPGAYVIFSSDKGDTWHDLTLVDSGNHVGYTALIETAPGELLVAFGEGYLRTDIENHVRMAYVHFESKL